MHASLAPASLDEAKIESSLSESSQLDLNRPSRAVVAALVFKIIESSNGRDTDVFKKYTTMGVGEGTRGLGGRAERAGRVGRAQERVHALQPHANSPATPRQRGIRGPHARVPSPRPRQLGPPTSPCQRASRTCAGHGHGIPMRSRVPSSLDSESAGTDGERGRGTRRDRVGRGDEAEGGWGNEGDGGTMGTGAGIGDRGTRGMRPDGGRAGRTESAARGVSSTRLGRAVPQTPRTLAAHAWLRSTRTRVHRVQAAGLGVEQRVLRGGWGGAGYDTSHDACENEARAARRQWFRPPLRTCANAAHATRMCMRLRQRAAGYAAGKARRERGRKGKRWWMEEIEDGGESQGTGMGMQHGGIQQCTMPEMVGRVYCIRTVRLRETAGRADEQRAHALKARAVGSIPWGGERGARSESAEQGEGKRIGQPYRDVNLDGM
ncbi:hypothetical protein C8F04DRAFT_1299941 [Mycena alexandri]|uniref:Uncharacterized protein n=1 Tax=Mycena alexandri TaxID=1745969 RepID=A0AAD6SDV6_9AGAR|nr:hypothetical protein C8F04DRAFT_1299941 [Mycena alexandri]